MTRGRFWKSAVLALWIFGLIGVPGRSEDLTLAQITADAIEAWMSLEQLWSHVDVACTMEYAYGPGFDKHGVLLSSDCHLRSNGFNRRCDSHQVSYGPGATTYEMWSVTCINDRYAFTLWKPQGKVSEPYQVAKFGVPDETCQSMMDWRMAPLRCTYAIPYDRLTSLLKSEGFVLLEARRLNQLGREMVQVEGEKRSTGGSRREVIAITLDPSAKWAVVDFRVTNELDTIIGELEFTKDPQCFPVPLKSVITSVRNGSPDHWACITTHYREVMNRILPDEEFTLSSCGLPELVASAAPITNNTSYWLLFAGTCLALAAVSLRAIMTKKGANAMSHA